MSYKFLVKRENGFIKELKKEYSEDKNYSAPQGWEELDTSSQEYQDYIDGVGDYSEEAVFARTADYKQKRLARYKELGCKQPEMMEALYESICEGRNEKLNALQALREQVKAEIPKT